MNKYRILSFFNVSCTDEYVDVNVLDLHENTKNVFLNYLKKHFWNDLSSVVASELNIINEIDISENGFSIDASISSSENEEEIETYIEAISEKSIWQSILQHDKTGDEMYIVFDETIKKSFRFQYISKISVTKID